MMSHLMRVQVLSMAFATVAAVVTPASGAETAVVRGGPDLLARLSKDQGRVFSEKPGGVVKALGGGKASDLKDGDTVKYVDDNGGIGMGEDTVATVVARKKRIKVPNGQVILEDRLQRSPDRKWAVFSALTACGDFCYATGWLLGPDLRLRLSESGFGPDVVVAWRSDREEVAIGSRGLSLVSLTDAKVTTSNGYTSPAYGPDGRLYVRGKDKSDAVYEWVLGGTPRKVLAMAGAPPPSESEDDRGDPDPVTFAADGRLVATFQRGDDTRVRTLALTGGGAGGSHGRGRSGAGGGSGTLEGTPAARPQAIEDTLALIDNAAPAAAAVTAMAAGERDPAFARELAVAANTRGYRLLQEGKLDDAIQLLEAAATLDTRYGMPRYNLARVHALKGNAKESVVYLHMLKIMGKAQRARLAHATEDDAFKKIADTEEFRALFK
jgi:hypothetical protein